MGRDRLNLPARHCASWNVALLPAARGSDPAGGGASPRPSKLSQRRASFPRGKFRSGPLLELPGAVFWLPGAPGSSKSLGDAGRTENFRSGGRGSFGAALDVSRKLRVSMQSLEVVPFRRGSYLFARGSSRRQKMAPEPAAKLLRASGSFGERPGSSPRLGAITFRRGFLPRRAGAWPALRILPDATGLLPPARRASPTRAILPQARRCFAMAADPSPQVFPAPSSSGKDAGRRGAFRSKRRPSKPGALVFALRGWVLFFRHGNPRPCHGSLCRRTRPHGLPLPSVLGADAGG